jgi:hypothetical protein
METWIQPHIVCQLITKTLQLYDKALSLHSLQGLENYSHKPQVALEITLVRLPKDLTLIY